MDFNAIMIIVTLALAGALTALKIRDWTKHEKILKAVKEKDALAETIKRKGQRVMFYVFLGAAVGFGALIFTPEIISTSQDNVLYGIAYVAVFLMMSVSEWFNIKTVETIHVFEKTVVYATSEFRVKSIRTIAASGKKNANVMMLDGTSSLVPVDVAAKLSALQKARKTKSAVL